MTVPRQKLDTWTVEGSQAHRERCIRDMRRARSEGWTDVDASFIVEPPVPCGVPPVGHPRRAESEVILPGGAAIPLPDYELGET